MFLFYYIFLFTLLSKNAFAYLDPGTFSIIGTIIASIFTAISAFIFFVRAKLQDFIKKIYKKNKKK